MGLGQNVSNISSGSGSNGPIYSEPNLANQFAYDMMFRIPGERMESADLLEGKKSKEGEETFEESSNVRNIDSKIDNIERHLRKQDKPSPIISMIKDIHGNDKRYYLNNFPHPQYLELSNNYNSNSNITSIISNYYDLFGQKENLGFNLQTLSRLSWSDIGDYFTTLINEMGLGQNVSNISGSRNSRNNSSGNVPIYSEPNLANQFAYDMMFRIPGERMESADLLEGKKSKEGEDTFEENK